MRWLLLSTHHGVHVKLVRFFSAFCKDRIESVKWDGIPRAETFFIDYPGKTVAYPTILQYLIYSKSLHDICTNSARYLHGFIIDLTAHQSSLLIPIDHLC